MLDPNGNGSRTLDLLHDHAATDDLIGWAWHPGAGNTVPINQRIKTSTFQCGHKLIREIDIVPRIRDKNLCLVSGARVRHLAGARSKHPFRINHFDDEPNKR
jgi:hypothetical protein